MINSKVMIKEFTLYDCCIDDNDKSEKSVLFELEAELVAELSALESIEPYSSPVRSNKIPFDNPSIFLLKISTCKFVSNQNPHLKFLAQNSFRVETKELFLNILKLTR